uniref:Uncharacterized protein n=1 Tax=Lepeophtheirus salmonis TaxID=72036 RepID=A0A0K2T997_LEPSM
MQIWKVQHLRTELICMKQSFLPRVMVFGLVSKEGLIKPRHIFEVGLKDNITVYLDLLRV